MSVGDPERGGHKWALNEKQSRPIIQKAAKEAISAFPEML